MIRRRILSFDMGTRNLAFALVQDNPLEVMRMGVIDLGVNASRDATDVLLDVLRGEHAWMADCCDEIVAELQPTNGACKILSFVLMTYFRLTDEFRERPVRPFRFMPAGFKLKYDEVLLTQLDPKTYDERKEAAVRMAANILADHSNDTMREFFRGQTPKRRTDLADAIVQACQHIRAPDVHAKKSRKK